MIGNSSNIAVDLVIRIRFLLLSKLSLPATSIRIDGKASRVLRDLASVLLARPHCLLGSLSSRSSSGWGRSRLARWSHIPRRSLLDPHHALRYAERCHGRNLPWDRDDGLENLRRAEAAVGHYSVVDPATVTVYACYLKSKRWKLYSSDSCPRCTYNSRVVYCTR